MNPFSRKSLAVALAGASLLSFTPPAAAVSVNPKGLGQVLLYPYYTVRSNAAGDAYTTLISVINATSNVKAVKVRFLEGKISAGVLDFNLYLSPNDVWTGAIVPTASGAKLISFDRSCTVPAISGTGIDFVNYAYASDPAGGSVDRVREGWFEILEMGVVGNTVVATAATHNSAGVPTNCALVRTDDGSGMLAPAGGLFGSASLVNVNAGTDYTFDPVALDAWRNAPLWTAPGSPTPDLADALPQRSTVLTTQGGQEQAIVTGGASWGGTNAADPVSAVLMHESVLNEFTLDPGTASGTDWVITFPTKRFYYLPVNNTQWQVTALFQRNFTSSGACDDYFAACPGPASFDREEQRLFISLCGFTTPPSISGAVCSAANVFSFQNTSSLNPGVLGSANKTTQLVPFQNGWMPLGFPSFSTNVAVINNNHQLTSSGATTVVFRPSAGTTTTSPSAIYFGLPSIGFAVTSYTNGNIGGVLSNYGGNWVHKYTDHIQTP